jgi:SPP1 family predicted phage head-tail adaptor
MNSGDLRHRIEIKKPSQAYDDLGQPLDKWILVKTIWAAISPAIGRNYYAAQQTQTEATVKINTRYCPDITRNMRVFHKGVAYDIIDVMDVNMLHEELVIYCKEVIT